MGAIAPEADSDIGRADFFISRAGADADLTGHIGRILEDAGYRVILQQWDFANRNFMARIHAALETGARVIALLSPDYLKSDYCMAEALNAIGHDPLNKKERLISMRVAEKTEEEMLRTPSFGRESLDEIRGALAGMGLRFGMEVPNWPPENIEELAGAKN